MEHHHEFHGRLRSRVYPIHSLKDPETEATRWWSSHAPCMEYDTYKFLADFWGKQNPTTMVWMIPYGTYTSACSWWAKHLKFINHQKNIPGFHGSHMGESSTNLVSSTTAVATKIGCWPSRGRPTKRLPVTTRYRRLRWAAFPHWESTHWGLIPVDSRDIYIYNIYNII